MKRFTEADILRLTHRALPGENWPGPVETLAGGSLNQVCRVHGESRSIVFKYAPPHIASQPDHALDPSRLAFEARALCLFRDDPDLGRLTGAVSPPDPLHHDPDRNILLIEDLGDGPTLAEALAAGTAGGTAGEALGRFIGGLHRTSAGRTDLAHRFNNRPIQQTRLDLQYAAVAHYAARAGAPTGDLDRIERRARALGNDLLRPGGCLVMGDLWPPSVLPRSTGLRLIDWEFCHFGRPLQDCAHLAAHCRMHALAAPTRAEAQAWLGFWEAFVRAVSDGDFPSDPPLDWNLHFAAEILMRTTGPFRPNGAFARIDNNDPRFSEACATAIDLLVNPEGPPAMVPT
ncbi:MAG: phosphotransferase family protein [Opitutales bacterium]